MARTRALTIGLLITATGCTDSRDATYPVRGQVLFSDGTPVRFGNVELRSTTNGRVARSVIQPSGRFTLGTFETADGAVAGEHQAIVVQLIPPDVLARRPASKLTDADRHHAHGPVDMVAPVFSRYSTTPLTVKVLPKAENYVELIVDPIQQKN